MDPSLSAFYDRLARHFRELYADDRVFVMGEGRVRPAVMLVGEAPGEKEALEGRPFVGRAGENLNDFLTRAGLSREQMFVSNVVKFRPVKPGKSGRNINRPPTREETELFTPWLTQEIALVRPSVVVTLGNVALKAVMRDSAATIGAFHGEMRETAGGLAVFPLYHPAAVIYNRALTDIYRADVARLKRLLAGDP